MAPQAQDGDNKMATLLSKIESYDNFKEWLSRKVYTKERESSSEKAGLALHSLARQPSTKATIALTLTFRAAWYKILKIKAIQSLIQVVLTYRNIERLVKKFFVEIKIDIVIHI